MGRPGSEPVYSAHVQQPQLMVLPLDAIRTDGGTQVRAAIDVEAVASYVLQIDALPPVVVVFDGEVHWLADGFHRVAAHRQAQRTEIAALVRRGTQRDAVLLACGANAEHGVRRSNRDKRAAVKRLLADEEWGLWSDRQIAEACGVSKTLVSQLRNASLGGAGGGNGGHPQLRLVGDDEGLEEPEDPQGGGDLAALPEAFLQSPIGAAELLRAAAAGIGAAWHWPPPSEAPSVLERLVAERRARHAEEACVVLPVDTTAPWFVDAWDQPLCFLARPLATSGAVAIAYVGERLEAFERAFEPLGRICVPTPFGQATRPAHRRLCAKCGVPCSSGRWCPKCKQLERADRQWMRHALDIARRELAAGREPSPRKIAVRVHVPWPDVVRVLCRERVGTDEQRAEWQRQAHLARKGDEP
jgi:hypothetical protein